MLKKSTILIALSLISNAVFALENNQDSRLDYLLKKAKERSSTAEPVQKTETVKPAPTPSPAPSKVAEPVREKSYEELMREYDAVLGSPSSKPVEKPAAQKPIVKPQAAPVQKPAAPVQKPIQAPISKPVQQAPVIKPSQPAVSKPAAVNNSGHAPVSKPAQQAPVVKKEIPKVQEAAPVTKPAEAPAAKEPVKTNDVTNTTRNVTPETVPSSSVTKTPEQREADYMLVVRKSLKSLEEDSWNDVKYNMGEALDYFAREKAAYKDPVIDIYYKTIQAFMKFAEGGLELDQGETADLEEAEALYLDSEDLLGEVEKSLNNTNPNFKNLKDIIDTVEKYISEDLDYIDNMISE